MRLNSINGTSGRHKVALAVWNYTDFLSALWNRWTNKMALSAIWEA
jgi:hypothetical protein